MKIFRLILELIAIVASLAFVFAAIELHSSGKTMDAMYYLLFAIWLMPRSTSKD